MWNLVRLDLVGVVAPVAIELGVELLAHLRTLAEAAKRFVLVLFLALRVGELLLRQQPRACV